MYLQPKKVTKTHVWGNISVKKFKIARKIINGVRRWLIDQWLIFRRRAKGSLGLATDQSAFSRCCVIHWDVFDARLTHGFHKNCQKKSLFQDMITAYLFEGSVVSVFQIIQLWISWCQLKPKKKGGLSCNFTGSTCFIRCHESVRPRLKCH